jgi:hypothetical protein
VFFSGERIIFRSYLKQGLTMNSDRFIDETLKPMLLSIKNPEVNPPFSDSSLLKGEKEKPPEMFHFFFCFFYGFFRDISSSSLHDKEVETSHIRSETELSSDSSLLFPPPILSYASCHCPAKIVPSVTPPPLLLHFDNAPSHKSKLTQAFLQNMKVEILSSPAYSPDLAPCDFFLFGFLKGYLKGQVFTSVQELKDGVDKILQTITSQTLFQVFENWRQRCLEVSVDGEFHEF